MTFLCGYAMIMAYKYGGRPECAFCAARYRHGTTTKRSPRGVRSGPTGARLFRYLGRNAARMPFFRLKAVRRRVRVDPICQKSIGYRLPMDDWRGAREVRGSVARNTANVFVSEEKSCPEQFVLRLRIYGTHRASLRRDRGVRRLRLTNGGMIRPTERGGLSMVRCLSGRRRRKST